MDRLIASVASVVSSNTPPLFITDPALWIGFLLICPSLELVLRSTLGSWNRSLAMRSFTCKNFAHSRATRYHQCDAAGIQTTVPPSDVDRQPGTLDMFRLNFLSEHKRAAECFSHYSSINPTASKEHFWGNPNLEWCLRQLWLGGTTEKPATVNGNTLLWYSV